MIPQLATGAPGLVLLDLLPGEEDGCDAYVVSLEIVRHHVLFAFRAARSAMRRRLPERSTTAASARISRTLRFIAFVAHLLAAEITL